jgi:hypothetical protein
MSRLTKDVQVDVLGRRVTARELDVSEIRAHLAGAGAAAEVDAVGVLLFDGISFADLTAMSDVTLDELGRLAPSEIKDIIAACREVNADFFAMMARLAKLG